MTDADPPSAPLQPDAILVLSFGGPEGPDDVMPFLRRVVAGRNVPDERLAEVAEQYALFGGVSPINDHNRELIDALRAELDRRSIDLPVYWGNRNWHPLLEDTVQQMSDDGIRRALVFTTSAFGSYSGCRQYREDLERAAAQVSGTPPRLEKLRLFYNHPGFVDPMVERVDSALTDHRHRHGRDAELVFTAHSIPDSMAASCDYEHQLRTTADVITDTLGRPPAPVVYQSRSGPPQIPWLEPDIGDHLHAVAAEGTTDVVVVPLGFVSDHMEVKFDLDTQAAAIAAELGVAYTRAGTVGAHPRFVTMICELIEERRSATPKLSVGPDGPWPDQCPDGHCLAPRRPG